MQFCNCFDCTIKSYTNKSRFSLLLLEELGIDIVPIVLEDPCGKETAPIAPYLCSALSLF